MGRLPVYWCAMYSPCLSIYLPVFIEAELPPELSIGEQHPSADSPWWLFVMRIDAMHIPRLPCVGDLQR